MLTLKNTCLIAASSLAVSLIATIEAPQAEAAVQQAQDQLLGANLQTSGEITVAQNDGRRGGRGSGARGGRGHGEGSRGGRGARGGATLPNESGGIRRSNAPNFQDRGGRGGRGDGARGGRGGNDNRGARGGRGGRGDGARGGRGGNDNRGARGGRGGNEGRGARGGAGGRNDGWRGNRGGRNDNRGARGGSGNRHDNWRGNRGGRNDNRGTRGARGGRGDAYRDGWRDGRTGQRNGIRDQRNGRGGAYNRGVRDGRDARHDRHNGYRGRNGRHDNYRGGYRGGSHFRDSRGSYRRGYVNGRIDARRYYRNYHRPARTSWHYNARYYNLGYNRHDYRYYDRGCRSNGDQVLAGAILGALFGAAVADDDAAGALVGGFFGAGLGSALNDCDRGQLHYAVSYSFANNSPYYWHNPYTGVRGVVYARDYYNYGGRRCRWGDAEIYMPDGSFVIDEVRMCQDAYGRWQVARNQ